MKIVVAIDSFKESLSSKEAAKAVKEGILKVEKEAEVIIFPVADGGEGTVDALVCGMNGVMQTVKVTGPLGENIECKYGMIPETKMAVIEMAQACGLALIDKEKRNPMITTTFGVGEMILDAIGKGCRKIILGIGGSATNDGGIGMLQALGFDCVDQNGDPVPYGAKGLSLLKNITDKNAAKELKECQFRIACDVVNPLCGETGCSRIFGPQKGADNDMVRKMDLWMKYYAEISRKYNPKADPDYPGSGAAGGIGFAFLTFLNSSLESGIHIILEETNLEEKIKEADLVITGEGCMDEQTSMGKTPSGVAALAKKYSCPVIAFAGCVKDGAHKCHECGIDAYFPILRMPVTLEEAMDRDHAYKNMVNCVEQVMRVWKMKG